MGTYCRECGQWMLLTPTESRVYTAQTHIPLCDQCNVTGNTVILEKADWEESND